MPITETLGIQRFIILYGIDKVSCDELRKEECEEGVWDQVSYVNMVMHLKNECFGKGERVVQKDGQTDRKRRLS